MRYTRASRRSVFGASWLIGLFVVGSSTAIWAGEHDEGGSNAGQLEVVDLSDPAGYVDGERAAWIVDDFEDGNITEWVDEGGGACTASTSTIAAAGAYSMRIDGACGHLLGRVLAVPSSQPTGVSVHVRSNTVDTNDTYFSRGSTCRWSSTTG